MHFRRNNLTHLAFACAVVLGSGGCVMWRDEPVRPAPQLNFVASDDPPSGLPPVASAEMRVAGPEAVTATKEERPVSEREPRYAITANELRFRFDHLAATIALSPNSLVATGRVKLARMRATLTEIDGALQRFKTAREESVPSIERELDRTLTDGDRLLQELSADVAEARAAGRK
jgi:hypothetical protein